MWTRKKHGKLLTVRPSRPSGARYASFSLSLGFENTPYVSALEPHKRTDPEGNFQKSSAKVWLVGMLTPSRPCYPGWPLKSPKPLKPLESLRTGRALGAWRSREANALDDSLST